MYPSTIREMHPYNHVHFQVLLIEPDTPADQIRKAYRKVYTHVHDKQTSRHIPKKHNTIQ